MDIEGEKSDEDATYVEDQGNKADRDTNSNLDGRDDVKTDVVLPQLNPNQDTGIDAIFGHNAQATSPIDISVTAIAEPSFFVPTNRPPTPTPLFIDNRLKALEDNFSEFKQTNKYVEALSSIPGIVDQYLANTYGDTVTIKKPRDGADDDQEPSAGTDQGSKRRRSGKKPESTSTLREKTITIAGKTTTSSKTHKKSASQSALVEETMQSTEFFEAPAHQEFETGVHDEQPEEEVHLLPDWFQQPKQLSSPDHAWNKSVPADHESVQPWLSNLERRQDPQESFDELTDTTFNFSAFVMNRLNVTTLTPELLAGLTFELMKG
ncbi:hypothetical protein Tco_0030287, partial [Tanacetum coccineum]